MKDLENYEDYEDYEVGLWSMEFYLINDDGDALRNDDGSIKLFDAPNIDFSSSTEGIEPDDLSNQLLAKIKKWLKHEVKQYKRICKRIDEGEEPVNVCENPEIFFFRSECSENLLDQIKEWEKEQE